MRPERGSGWLVLVLTLAALLPGCASLWPFGLEAPQVVLVDMETLESTLFEQRVRLDLRVLNPNGTPLEIEGVDLRLELNDVRLARALGSERLSVPARGEARTSLVASITLLDVVRQALALAEREAKS